jgi:AmmeMemoRadiSam system protein A
MTKAAAFEDSRFSPVTADELNDITITISVLTPAKPIASYNDIVLGRDGIILTNGAQSALFLPHVATEFKWDLPTTLTQLSEKAGLNPDAWKNKETTYQTFESIDFSE